MGSGSEKKAEVKIKERIVKKVLIYMVVMMMISITTIPVAWMLVTSFKTGSEVYRYPPTFLPLKWTFSNYLKVFAEYKLGRAAANSLIVAFGTTMLLLCFGALAGYGHSKFRFPGNTTLFLLALILRMVPPISILVPLYTLGRFLGVLSTLFWLVLLNLAFNLPTAIWIFKVFFDNLPRELLDAAKIDGCGNIATFSKIVAPLSKPAAGVIFVLLFTGVWNEFLMARTFVFGAAARTLPVALEPVLNAGLDIIGVHWGHVTAGAIIVLLPLFPVAVLFQKYLVSGMLGGAVKG